MSERIIERSSHREPNGGFNRFKDLVFAAIVLGAGGIIWAQQDRLATIERDVAVLKVECKRQPGLRGAPDGNP